MKKLFKKVEQSLIKKGVCEMQVDDSPKGNKIRDHLISNQHNRGV